MSHVPEMKSNLISLGMLEESGCTYMAEKGLLKVMKRSLVVMKGIIINHDIYILKGQLVIGVARAVVTSPNRTSLWHQRLGHVSLKG